MRIPQHPATSTTCRRRTAGVASVAEEAARAGAREREREGLPKEERERAKKRGEVGRGRRSECSGLVVYIPRDYRRSG